MNKKNEGIIQNLKEIGTRVKEVRKTLRINQKQMADKLGIFNSYLSDIENGKGNPGHSFFFKISNLFKVNLNYLFLGKGEMFLKSEQTREEDIFIDEIKTIEDLTWHMKNSPIFFHHMMSIAARFKYEYEEVINRNIEKNRARKDEET